jgi:hypothetical protein
MSILIVNGPSSTQQQQVDDKRKSVVECMQIFWDECFCKNMILHEMNNNMYCIDVELTACWTFGYLSRTSNYYIAAMKELYDTYVDRKTIKTNTNYMSQRSFTKMIDELFGFQHNNNNATVVVEDHNNTSSTTARVHYHRHHHHHRSYDKNVGYINIRDVYRFVMWRCPIESSNVLHFINFVDIFVRLLCKLELGTFSFVETFYLGFCEKSSIFLFLYR